MANAGISHWLSRLQGIVFTAQRDVYAEDASDGKLLYLAEPPIASCSSRYARIVR